MLLPSGWPHWELLALCMSICLLSLKSQTPRSAACVSRATSPHWFLAGLVQAARFSVNCRTDFKNLGKELTPLSVPSTENVTRMRMFSLWVEL